MPQIKSGEEDIWYSAESWAALEWHLPEALNRGLLMSLQLISVDLLFQGFVVLKFLGAKNKICNAFKWRYYVELWPFPYFVYLLI